MTRQLIIDQLFDLDAILEGAQDFRWRPWKDNWHSGVLGGNLIHIRQIDHGVEYRPDSDLDALLRSYFRLDDNIDSIHADISCRDDNVARLLTKHPHLRILRQPDPWECVVAYICSARSRISKIITNVEAISKALGRPVELDGEMRHTFPTPEMVLNDDVGRLKELNLGLDRHSKVIAAAERMRDGKLDLCYLARPQVCYAEAKRRLMGCYGIGDKVADCIALFALDKLEAFPVDVWVERAMARYFPCQRQPTGDELVMWAQDRFGKYAGYANQLLFHEQRTNGGTAQDIEGHRSYA